MKNKTLKLIFLVAFTLFSLNPTHGEEIGGTSVVGGSNPKRIEERTARRMIEDEAIKKAMLHYLETIQVDKIENKTVRNFFLKPGRMNEILLDIKRSEYFFGNGCKDIYGGANNITSPKRSRYKGDPNYEAVKKPKYKGDLNHLEEKDDVFASTEVGVLGADICFDGEKTIAVYKEKSMEEATIRLAAIAFHEHVHHFQDPKANAEKNEFEADEVAAYVRMTAVNADIPLLKWAPEQNSISSKKPGYLVIGINEDIHLNKTFYFAVPLSEKSLIGFDINQELEEKSTHRISCEYTPSWSTDEDGVPASIFQVDLSKNQIDDPMDSNLAKYREVYRLFAHAGTNVTNIIDNQYYFTELEDIINIQKAQYGFTAMDVLYHEGSLPEEVVLLDLGEEYLLENLVLYYDRHPAVSSENYPLKYSAKFVCHAVALNPGRGYNTLSLPKLEEND